MINSGFILSDPTTFANKAYGSINKSLGLEADSKIQAFEVDMSSVE